MKSGGGNFETKDDAIYVSIGHQVEGAAGLLKQTPKNNLVAHQEQADDHSVPVLGFAFCEGVADDDGGHRNQGQAEDASYYGAILNQLPEYQHPKQGK